jgi:glycosyltransferase involved in cell wall biosynthesis
VSVVIPTRGRPSLLKRAVESALCQTVSELEIVVVIDGADPESVDALASIQDPRIRYLALDEKVGGAEARNAGARAANGAWIALLDDDDEWLQDKLEKQLAGIDPRSADAVLVTSLYICRTEGVPDVIRPRRMPGRNEPLADFMFDYLCYFQTSTFLCPRKLFLENPFDKDAAFFQDIDWMLRLSKLPDFRLIVTPEPLAIYYMPSNLPGITSRLGWRSRIQWGKDRRTLMSRRAYSRFVVGSCVSRAAQEGGGWEAFRMMFHEACVVGSATPSLFALLCMGFLVPPEQRKRVRDMFFLTRAARLHPAPEK